MSTAIWLGFFDLRPEVGSEVLDGAIGAAVYAAAKASDVVTFEQRVTQAALELGLLVAEMEEAGPALARGVRSLRGNHRRLISEARRTGTVAWGTFHTYDRDEE
jgi:sorbitol-specific phosphotransferase system component IIA